MSLRVRCFLVLGALSAFLVLMALSAAVYPGGSYHDRAYPRHHFWHNFLCDLLHQRALGGAPNLLGARLATGGMLALVLSMGVYWTLAPALMPGRPWLGRACAMFGVLSSVGLVAVALTPSDRLPRLHTLAIVLATAPGLLAALSVVGGRLAEPGASWALRALGGAALLAVAATSALFVIHTWFAGGYLRALPAMQRVAAILTVAWVGSTTARLLAGEAARGAWVSLISR
ncbi:MAG: hypothetical protein KA712_24980 [Myxococcales bacterium]|nr:hypothetical protein [Myxococcales bacterium]